MRDLYVKDDRGFYRTESCTKCGADKLFPTKRKIHDIKNIVANDIAMVIPRKSLSPEEGITYECKCHEADKYALVNKEIPVWIDKKVYELDICPNCKAEGTITVHGLDNDISDMMHSFELHCSRCHKPTNLSKVTHSERTDAQVQRDWDDYEKLLLEQAGEQEKNTHDAMISKARFKDNDEIEDAFFDLDEEYETESERNEPAKASYSNIEIEEDLEISLDMDIEI